MRYCLWYCHTIVYQLDWLVVLCDVFVFVGDHVIDISVARGGHGRAFALPSLNFALPSKPSSYLNCT